VNLLHDVLIEAKTMISGWGGKLYFVFLPQWERYVPGLEPNPDRDRVLEAAKKAELRIVDIHEAFLRQPDPAGLFPFRLGGHYNERGISGGGRSLTIDIAQDLNNVSKSRSRYRHRGE